MRLNHLVLLYIAIKFSSAVITKTRTHKVCGARVVTSVIVYKSSIHLQTSFSKNGTYAINPALTLAVSNAPTFLDTITSYTSRTTISGTTYPSPSPLSSVSDSTSFILAVGPGTMGNSNGNHQRRQAFSFLGLSGRTSTDCSNAATFSLTNGALTYTNGSGIMSFGTSSAAFTSYDIFIPTYISRPITTTFSLGLYGSLLWLNSSFPTGGAKFCVRNDGTILTVFVLGTQPDDCAFIDITISDLATCPQGFAAITGPTGPRGSSGAIGKGFGFGDWGRSLLTLCVKGRQGRLVFKVKSIAKCLEMLG